MSAHKFYSNFTGGEWTPLLDGRSDLDKYDSACRTLENFRVLPYGGARFRPGFKHVVRAKDGATYQTRLVPFQFSVTTRFMLQLGHLNMRFIGNGIQIATAAYWENTSGYTAGQVVKRIINSIDVYYECILDIGSTIPPVFNPFPETDPTHWELTNADAAAYEIATPWSAADIFAIQFKQINDVIYFVHPSYPPYKLSRVTDVSWTLAEVAWVWPAFLDENIGTTSLAVSHTTGAGRTMTASAPLFNAQHVGSYWEIRHLRAADSVSLAIDTTSGTTSSSSMSIKGDWQVTTSNFWFGVLTVERSENGGSSWEVVRKFTGASDRNVSASGTQLTEALLRLTYVASGDPFGSTVWAGTAPTDYVKAKAVLESQEAYIAGIVKVTGYTSTTSVTVTVVDALETTNATGTWSEGAWSAYRGYPRAIGLFEQRLYFGGTAYQPIRFWGSVTGDFENFEYGDTDDAAVAFDMAATESNPVQWMEAMDAMQVGTLGGEFLVKSANTDEPITPTNVTVRGQSAYGAAYLQAIAVNDVVLFVQRQARRVREMSYNIERDRYVAPDLTLLAEHVTEAGITQMAFCRQPDPLLLLVTGDGALAALTYNREQNITAWMRFVTDGDIESVASIYGTPEDEIWVVVKRTIDGATVRHVERMAVETDVKEDACHLDDAITGVCTSTTISGLTHLNGATVRVVINGAVAGDFPVASGSLTATGVTTFGNFVVGIPYTGSIKPMKLDINMANGPSQGRRRRIVEAAIRFHETLGCKFGREAGALDAVEFRAPEDPLDASPPLFTGDKVVYWQSGWDRTGDIIIQQDQPLPCTVLGIAVKFDVVGD